MLVVFYTSRFSFLKNKPIKTDLSNILKSNLVDTTDEITKKSEIKYVAANN